MASHQQDIDNLLERYLTLLHEYTSLRKDLSHLQSTIFQDIARANFSGERGQRFGQDQYDQRMQATRKVEIEHQDEPFAHFSIVNTEAQESTLSLDASDDTPPGDQEKPRRKSRDPLRWFGILTPPALRAAQAHSVKIVEEVVPRLVSVAAEMQHVEIMVRRTRKRRAKAKGATKATLDTEPVRSTA